MNVLSRYLRNIVTKEELIGDLTELPLNSILIYTKKYSHKRSYEIYICNYTAYRIYYSGPLSYIANINLL